MSFDMLKKLAEVVDEKKDFPPKKSEDSKKPFPPKKNGDDKNGDAAPANEEKENTNNDEKPKDSGGSENKDSGKEQSGGDKNPFAKKDKGSENGNAPVGEEQPATSEEEEESGENQQEQQAASGTVDPMMVMDFIAANQGADDAAFHAFAEQNGFNVHEAEATVYRLANAFMEMVRGGKGYGLDIASVDPQQLEMGLKIEAEHSSNPAIQKKIALDHLAENPEYYSADVFQAELQKEHGGGQQQGGDQPPADGTEKQSSLRPNRFRDAMLEKTAAIPDFKRRNLGKYLSDFLRQARRQSASTSKRNISNITRAIKNPSKPLKGFGKTAAIAPQTLTNKLVQAASKLKKPGTFNRVLDKA